LSGGAVTNFFLEIHEVDRMSFATIPYEQLRTRHGNKWNRFDADVIPCWVADMDFALAPPINDALQGALQRQEFGYPSKQNRLAEVFAERMQQRFGWSPDPAGVVELTDVVQGFYIAYDRLLEAGEGVVVSTPIYPPILMGIEETGRRLVRAPLQALEQGWALDIDAMAGAIDAGTKMLVMCNPHNPTGRVFTRQELEGVAELVERHDLIVLADEIHADLVYPGAQHIPFASLSEEMARRTITFTSATKAFNTAGLRCAIAHFGDLELLKKFQSLLPRFRGGIGVYASEVTCVAWEQCQPWLDEALVYLQGNRDLIARTVAERMPGVKFATPQSTYLAWLDFTDIGLNRDPHQFFLEKARVGLSEGPTFGIEGEGCTRLNFATDRKILQEILDRMVNALA
jgi:cystathionine beta-lyase